MLRKLCGRNVTSSPDDTRVVVRSLTEDHVKLSSRDMSADDRTPERGKESSISKEKRNSDHSVQKYTVQNNNDNSIRSFLNSPRPMSSRAYTPLPFIKPNTLTSEIADNTGHNVEVITPRSERFVGTDTKSLVYTSVKLPRIYSPVPYSRHCASYSPVHWQKPVETNILEEKHSNNQQATDLQQLEKKLLSEIPTSGDNTARNYPVPPPEANNRRENIVAVNEDEATDLDRMPENMDDYNDIERAKEMHACNSLEDNIKADVIQKVKRRKEQLIQMKPSEKEYCNGTPEAVVKQRNKKSTTVTKQDKPEKAAECTQAAPSTVKESKETEYTKEIQELKMVYEAHLKEKEEFEKLIEKRENELNEQLREMDEVMDSFYSERTEIEKITGSYADAIKAYTNHKDELTRVRVQNKEQEISSDILFEENAELKDEIRELYDHINEIKERRAIGLLGLKQDTENIKGVAKLLRDENEEIEAETKQKVEDFSNLRMVMMDKGLTYVKKGNIVSTGDNAEAFQRTNILKSTAVKSSSSIRPGFNIDIAEVGSSSSRNYDTTENDGLSNKISEQALNLEGTERGFDDIETDQKHVGGFLFDENQKQNHDRRDSSAKLMWEKFGMDDVSASMVKDERTCIDNSKSDESVKQMHAMEFVRLSVIRETKSQIPKPLVRPYGSASRDGDRFTISESNSLIMAQNENYERDAFVPQDQRNVTQITMDYLDPEIELCRLNKTNERKGEGSHETYYRVDEERYDDAGKCSVFSGELEELEGHEIYWTDEKRMDYFGKKHERNPKPCKKKEIKSKIDTGLNNGQCNVSKMNKTATIKETKRKVAPVKNSIGSTKANARKEQSCVNAKRPDLPQLKNSRKSTKKANIMPNSSTAFGNKSPLPNILPASEKTNKAPFSGIEPGIQRRKECFKENEKIVSTPCRVLPPIKSSKTNGAKKSLKNGDSAKRFTQISSRHQTPEPLWVSFSPSPPPRAARSGVRPDRSRMPKLQGSSQDDNKRVFSERA